MVVFKNRDVNKMKRVSSPIPVFVVFAQRHNGGSREERSADNGQVDDFVTPFLP